jgi:hypothetical protein
MAAFRSMTFVPESFPYPTVRCVPKIYGLFSVAGAAELVGGGVLPDDSAGREAFSCAKAMMRGELLLSYLGNFSRNASSPSR